MESWKYMARPSNHVVEDKAVTPQPKAASFPPTSVWQIAQWIE